MITEAECANTKNDLETHLNISDKTTRYDTKVSLLKFPCRFLVVPNPLTWFHLRIDFGVFTHVLCVDSPTHVLFIFRGV